jgi:protein phosphatase
MNRNPRIGFYYLITAASILALSPWLSPLLPLLLWMIASMLWVALGYFFWGSRIYRKRQGTLSLASIILLAPTRLGQVLSLVYYRKKCRAWDDVLPGLTIGRVLTSKEAKELISKGITAVLDLTVEFSETKELLNLDYLNIPILDLTAPTPEQTQQAVDFISNCLENKQALYVEPVPNSLF